MIGKDYICSIMQNKGVIMTTLELEEKKKIMFMKPIM